MLVRVWSRWITIDNSSEKRGDIGSASPVMTLEIKKAV